MRSNSALLNWKTSFVVEELSWKGLSVFDLDHTLLNANSSYRFGLFLHEKRIFSTFHMCYYASCYFLHLMGILSLTQVQERIFHRLFLNRRLEEWKRQACLFVDAHFTHLLYPPAIEKLKLAKNNGHAIVILSSGPDFLVQFFAERLDVDAWSATEYGVDEQGCLNSIKCWMLPIHKQLCVEHLTKQLGLQKDQVIAYSDSICDLPFLKAAGHAVVVNPGWKLRRYARKNQWTVI